MLHPPLLVIGCGNMGRAILIGAHQKGVIDPARIVICDPDTSKRDQIAAHLQINPASIAWMGSLTSALEHLDHLEGLHGVPGHVLLAIKPQMLRAVADQLNTAIKIYPGTTANISAASSEHIERWSHRIIISILAGMTSSSIQGAFGGKCKVIRAMPNLPASIGQGATAITLPHAISPIEAEFARALFTAIGPLVIELPEELMDAFTAVAGSGPAYLFYLAQAMIEGGIACGLSPEQALTIVKQTLTGAAALLDQSTQMPAQLRETVTSKGGTTAAAVAHLDSAQVMHEIRQAVQAARDRGKALAAGQ